MLDVEIRPIELKDMGYVWATFRDSYRSEQPDMANDEFEEWLRPQLNEAGRVLVAHVAGEPALLVGWLAMDGGALLYAYVRKERRREGIARRLLDRAQTGWPKKTPLIVRHLTRDGRRIKASHSEVRYIPR